MNQSIYRFIPFESLLEMLVDGHLVLAKTSKWDDPFENYFFKCNVYKNGNILDVKEISERMYGQCWSLTPESDALWRIYSSDKKGVRIKTTLNQLFEVVNPLSSANSSDTGDSIWIGKVEYKTSDYINSFFDSQKHMGHVMDSKFMIKSMLLKRREFEHENEVRIIYVGDRDFKENIKSYKINFNKFISEVMFDPRISPRVEKLYSTVLANLGFRGSIKKSSLYSFEPQRINLL